MTNSRNACLGEPEDYQGGDLRFCDAPTKPGRRFCDRCQVIRESTLRSRVLRLLSQYQHETRELQELIREGLIR